MPTPDPRPTSPPAPTLSSPNAGPLNLPNISPRDLRNNVNRPAASAPPAPYSAITPGRSYSAPAPTLSRPNAGQLNLPNVSPRDLRNNVNRSGGSRVLNPQSIGSSPVAQPRSNPAPRAGIPPTAGARPGIPGGALGGAIGALSTASALQEPVRDIYDSIGGALNLPGSDPGGYWDRQRDLAINDPSELIPGLNRPWVPGDRDPYPDMPSNRRPPGGAPNDGRPGGSAPDPTAPGMSLPLPPSGYGQRGQLLAVSLRITGLGLDRLDFHGFFWGPVSLSLGQQDFEEPWRSHEELLRFSVIHGTAPDQIETTTETLIYDWRAFTRGFSRSPVVTLADSPNSPLPTPQPIPRVDLLGFPIPGAPAIGSPTPTPTPTPTPSPRPNSPAPNPFPTPTPTPTPSPAPGTPPAPSPAPAPPPGFPLPLPLFIPALTGTAPRGGVGTLQTPQFPRTNTPPFTVRPGGGNPPGICLYNPALDQQINQTTQNNLQLTQNVDRLTTIINTIQLVEVNNKLGPQLGNGGISGFLKRFAQSSLAQGALNAINLWANLHNAFMLSNNLRMTLFSAFDLIYQLPGMSQFAPKDPETGETIPYGDWAADQIDSMFRSIFGDQTVNTVRATWLKANRIYQAASNLMFSLQSLMWSLMEVVEIIGNYVALIGNALRKFGIVGDNAYGWMNPNAADSRRFTKVFEALQNAEEVVSNVEAVAANAVDATETVSQLNQQSQALDRALRGVGENGQPLPEYEGLGWPWSLDDRQPQPIADTEQGARGDARRLDANDAIPPASEVRTEPDEQP